MSSSELQPVRLELRQALASAAAQGSSLRVTVRGEQDLQQLVDLVRGLGGNPLLAGAGEGAGLRVQIEIAPGKYGVAEACGCGGGTPSSGAAGPVGKQAVPAAAVLEGLVSQARLQANQPLPADLVLAADAVLTPSARDWLRTQRVRVRRSST